MEINGGAYLATVEEKDFSRLERDAEDLFNPLTNFFYVKHDIDADPDTERVKLFRKALVLQINYTNDLGASTSYDIAGKDIKTVSIDGTSVTTGKSAVDESVNGVYKLALSYLVSTGLMYRGVPHC